jgi:hypothetical protein
MAAPAYLAAAGLLNIGQTLYGRKRRRQEMATAQSNFNRTMATYQNLDTTNPYANMENPMEDLTVNQQEADFIAQQQQQGMANTMSQMSGAAGGSGIASLAQAMANQQSQNAIQAGARIGAQEARNNAMAAQGAMRIQSMERQGDYLSQQMQRQQAGTELGMAQQELGQARAARDQATNQVFQGLGQLTSAGIGTWNAYSSGTDGRGPLDNSFFGVENNF